MAELRLDAVRKVYDNGHVAVAGATFAVADGEFLVLVGPSGCGKSTLLRMIAGLESISSGTLAIGGRPVNDVAPKDRDIAMVFQNYALYPHMSVYENLAFGLRLRDVPRAEIDRRVRAAAHTLELAAMLERKPGQLSGGQRQRVALGRALVRDPSVFLLDEPLSNLDARLRLGMRVELARLHRQLGTTMIYVTHDQIEAMTLGQRIVVMKDGEIQQIDTPMNLYAKPDNLFVAGFLGSPAMNLLRGRVVADHRLWLDTGHTRLPLDGTPELAVLARGAGGELVAGLRPEDLVPAHGDAPAASLRAELELVEPVGNEVFLNLRCGNDALVARVPPQALPAAGTMMTLAFDPARLHLFDSASERRLGA
ncbi:MAG TPA: sn-glycerol-3-phosphate ABC transporter ATP-binding protein UgpC [Dokdonella sp.]|uniref:ABC transporter ATP-binding protein n=1 Tax=Dokdonella sp. TaxID=2291710 RepID=UPI0025C3A90A|nr:sn-glycerol-3-phosphate ABC transporter ATP-binding protein UgpC [Dokdonella sp.]MBX3691785.1 sn-glycerol-3-phosphate ABC transporter ATP-binding protein UgpC [Dokdonella sp.]MCW5566692.1 sn-glycerol-3-phosphate ABC transporter ATP-binding protein UgpC [Dokdonella sp.]HNR90786.1 sn-glycerol-3-phosphate ABC transporter ATP-binding protein UgpC [Dokdonella sp.]